MYTLIFVSKTYSSTVFISVHSVYYIVLKIVILFLIAFVVPYSVCEHSVFTKWQLESELPVLHIDVPYEFDLDIFQENKQFEVLRSKQDLVCSPVLATYTLNSVK